MKEFNTEKITTGIKSVLEYNLCEIGESVELSTMYNIGGLESRPHEINIKFAVVEKR